MTVSASPRRLKIGIAGIGRIGRRHALIYLQQTPRAHLVAVSTPAAEEREWAQENLAPHGVTVYENYDDMLKHEGLEAVLIASAASVHADQTLAGIAAGKHVLCEKPLSTSVDRSQDVVEAAAKRPDLKVMCGFSRRFDASYRDAHAKMSSGMIGRPSIFRSQTCDVRDRTGWFFEYAKTSGGIFVDSCVHDIDLALWFMGEDNGWPVRSVSAAGIVAMEPRLHEINDRDNGVGIVELNDGKIVYLYCSRMMVAGQEDTTEIIGTEGKLTVNLWAANNLVRVYQESGVTQELPQSYWDRFRAAFTQEANEFTAAVLDDKPVPVPLQTTLMVMKIGKALQDSMISGDKIWFNQKGERISKPSS